MFRSCGIVTCGGSLPWAAGRDALILWGPVARALLILWVAAWTGGCSCPDRVPVVEGNGARGQVAVAVAVVSNGPRLTSRWYDAEQWFDLNKIPAGSQYVKDYYVLPKRPKAKFAGVLIVSIPVEEDFSASGDAVIMTKYLGVFRDDGGHVFCDETMAVLGSDKTAPTVQLACEKAVPGLESQVRDQWSACGQTGDERRRSMAALLSLEHAIVWQDARFGDEELGNTNRALSKAPDPPVARVEKLVLSELVPLVTRAYILGQLRLWGEVGYLADVVKYHESPRPWGKAHGSMRFEFVAACNGLPSEQVVPVLLRAMDGASPRRRKVISDVLECKLGEKRETKEEWEELWRSQRG